MSDILSKQDKIWLYGGYDMAPKWLQGKRGYFGKVISFIPGQNDSDAAVVELEESITIDDLSGKILVLELRYVGAKWKSQETVHIELCDFIPEAKRWQERRKGKWIESHASYKKV